VPTRAEPIDRNALASGNAAGWICHAPLTCKAVTPDRSPPPPPPPLRRPATAAAKAVDPASIAAPACCFCCCCCCETAALEAWAESFAARPTGTERLRIKGAPASADVGSTALPALDPPPAPPLAPPPTPSRSSSYSSSSPPPGPPPPPPPPRSDCVPGTGPLGAPTPRDPTKSWERTATQRNGRSPPTPPPTPPSPPPRAKRRTSPDASATATSSACPRPLDPPLPPLEAASPGYLRTHTRRQHTHSACARQSSSVPRKCCRLRRRKNRARLSWVLFRVSTKHCEARAT